MLDAGAQGIIIPMVNSAEEAVRAVDATKYPPLGQRSHGPTIIGGRAEASARSTTQLRMTPTRVYQ